MKIKSIKTIFTGLVISLLLTACIPVATPPTVSLPLPPNKILRATGYGTVDKSDKYSRSQIKLMAMRASKMDAYRSLVEQIYGVHLDGMTTVENMVVTHDSYRAFIHAFLRGARVVRVSAIGSDLYAGDDTFETVIEIDLTPRFYECLNGSGAINNQCLQQTSAISAPNPDYASASASASASAMQNASISCNTIDCYSYPETRGFIQR